ncbi:hypothetical protein GOP47_0008566 [Adiantum capillus-veneris]|uniref:Uncharacterized protein n=1 Tax=Adiantum capillus-veneris TaxID=13818 RepID=A0A9D4UYM9_ADICA|nr:hypothetical protein GOP47_0008566 [Adiantum capillus-veneris]
MQLIRPAQHEPKEHGQDVAKLDWLIKVQYIFGPTITTGSLNPRTQQHSMYFSTCNTRKRYDRSSRLDSAFCLTMSTCLGCSVKVLVQVCFSFGYL